MIDLQPIQVSDADREYREWIQANTLTPEQICRVFALPPELLGASSRDWESEIRIREEVLRNLGYGFMVQWHVLYHVV